MHNDDNTPQWYVMRDLKRRNAKDPAYKQLVGKVQKLFVPMKWQVVSKQGVKVREEVPVIQDLLFVCDSRSHLDAIVESIRTLQYRWLRNTYREPMTVSGVEMERFILAVSSSENPVFFLPEEITPQMYGKRIRIVGGPLNGFEGRLLKARGCRVKRLIVELDGYLAVAVEVLPEYIQFV